MRVFIYTMIACAGISAMSGCHCFRCTDTVMDHLDDVTTKNDYHRGLDRFYCPSLDVTRWCMHGPCVGNNCR